MIEQGDDKLAKLRQVSRCEICLRASSACFFA